MGLLELGAATLRGGERRVEVAAQNAVNTETPGYKAQIAFSELQQVDANAATRLGSPDTVVEQLRTQGTLYETGGKLDLAINGTGYFLVRNGEEFSLTRGGEFGIDTSGSIVDAQGRVLQLATGGDATTSNFAIEVLRDGTMLDGEVPIGTIGIFEAPDRMGSGTISTEQIAALEEAQDSELNQAMLERSNVTLSDEMIELMRAQRQVESGAQIIRAYDQLLDRAISTFDRRS